MCLSTRLAASMLTMLTASVFICNKAHCQCVDLQQGLLPVCLSITMLTARAEVREVGKLILRCNNKIPTLESYYYFWFFVILKYFHLRQRFNYIIYVI